MEFDLSAALLAELIELFDEMKPQTLTEANADRIPNGQGVYQLFLADELVYVGKTDAKAGLADRLVRHARKISSRLNLDPAKVSFRAVRIYVFTPMDLERLLIDHYSVYAKPAWNNSGFGANDPGRKRDHTALKKGHFDALYPIDLHVPVAFERARVRSAASVLSQLKAQLPFNIRYQCDPSNSTLPHPELLAASVRLARRSPTAQDALSSVAKAMGTRWQITKLSGYVIVYRERRRYTHGLRIR